MCKPLFSIQIVTQWRDVCVCQTERQTPFYLNTIVFKNVCFSFDCSSRVPDGHACTTTFFSMADLFQIPRLVESLKFHQCSQVAAAKDHTVVLMEDGCVYTFGLNTFHQLGILPPPPNCSVPRQVKIFFCKCVSFWWTVNFGRRSAPLANTLNQ